MSSLLIGKTIYNTLESNSALVKLVGKNIFPLVADAKTTFPFITYQRTGIAANKDTKDRLLYKEIATVVINVATDKYLQGIDIAELVRESLSKYELTDADEQFSEDTYILKLTYNIKIK